jgi:hypothetical protein
MVTATFGGLTRDVVCQLPKQTQGVGRILHSEAPLYATTALAGGAAYVFPSSVMALLHCHYERNLREICSYKPIRPWSGQCCVLHDQRHLAQHAARRCRPHAHTVLKNSLMATTNPACVSMPLPTTEFKRTRDHTQHEYPHTAAFLPLASATQVCSRSVSGGGACHAHVHGGGRGRGAQDFGRDVRSETAHVAKERKGVDITDVSRKLFV